MSRRLLWLCFGSLLLGLTGCGKGLEVQAARAAGTFDGLSLEEDQVEVLGTRKSGDSILAEIRVTTAVRLVRKGGEWRIAEIRLGDRRWEKADHILAILHQERTETTLTRLGQLHRAVHRHLESEGTVPQVQTSTALVDALYPRFLAEAVRLDAWSNSFIYEPLSLRDYRLRSPGADGEAGTADDIAADSHP